MSIKWNELLSSITIALMYFANYNRLFIFTKLNFKKTSLVSFKCECRINFEFTNDAKEKRFDQFIARAI